MGDDFFSNFLKGGDFENEFGKPWCRLRYLNSNCTIKNLKPEKDCNLGKLVF